MTGAMVCISDEEWRKTTIDGLVRIYNLSRPDDAPEMTVEDSYKYILYDDYKGEQ